MVGLPVTEVSQARYPVIDVHCHLNDGIVMTRSVDPQQFLHVMDATNVEAAVNLTGGWGQKLRTWLKNMGQRFPGRFYVFCQIDYSRIDDSYLVESIQEAYEEGDDTRRRPTADPTPATPSGLYSPGTRSHLASATEIDASGRPPRSKTGPPTPASLADNLPRPETLVEVS
jgi:hypothetical protein